MKKILFSISLILSILFLTTVSSYALTTKNNDIDNIGNSVKNIIGGAENKIEDTAKNAADSTKKATNSMGDTAGKAGEDIKNTAENVGNAIEKGAENTGNAIKDATENIANNGNYTAEKTSTDMTNNNNFMGTEAWSWIVIALIVIAVIALFWYFAAHSKNNRK